MREGSSKMRHQRVKRDGAQKYREHDFCAKLATDYPAPANVFGPGKDLKKMSTQFPILYSPILLSLKQEIVCRPEKNQKC